MTKPRGAEIRNSIPAFAGMTAPAQAGVEIRNKFK
jgi:hypothetical protein